MSELSEAFDKIGTMLKAWREELESQFGAWEQEPQHICRTPSVNDHETRLNQVWRCKCGQGWRFVRKSWLQRKWEGGYESDYAWQKADKKEVKSTEGDN